MAGPPHTPPSSILEAGGSSIFHGQAWWVSVNEFAAHHQHLLLVALVCSLAPILLIAAVSSYQLYRDIARRDERILRLFAQQKATAEAAPATAPRPITSEDYFHPHSLPARSRHSRPRTDAAGLPLKNSAAPAYETFAVEAPRRAGRGSQGNGGH